MSFPRYEKHKDSGVEWLGEVPEEWGVVPIKLLSPVQRGASPRPIDDPKYFDDNGEYAWVRIADVTASNGLLTETTQRLSDLGSSLSVRLNAGSLFLSIAGSVGKPCVTGMKACIHDGFVYFPGLTIDQTWLYRVFEAGVCYGGLGKMGTQLNLNTDTVGSIRIAVPSTQDMGDILAFLDHETGKIDALVAEQEKLIGLLKEKRQAVISHAVTKGLDPNARMKDSGVEWLGEVPEGWEVKRLKSLVAEPLKYGANEAAEIDDPMLPRFVRITDIDDKGGLRDETFKSLPVEVAEPYLLKEGDVLLARSGATVGKSFIYSKHWGTACFAGYLIRARLDCSYCLAQWLYYFCQTNEYWGYIVGSQIQATIQNVSAEKYANLYLPIPSTKEQRTIAAFLDHETTQIDALIEEAKKAIELMKERRTALISAAVTGKIDLRGRV